MKIKVSMLLLLSSVIILSSCSRDAIPQQEESAVNSTISIDGDFDRAPDLSEIAAQIKESSKDIIYDKNMVKRNAREFLATYNEDNPDKFTNEEVIAVLERDLGIKGEGIAKLLQIGYENHELLLEEGAREALIEELTLLLGRSPVAADRGLFASLYAMFSDDDTHCSIQVLAHIADAMVSTALFAATAVTGVGAVINGANLVGSFGAAVVTANNCN